MLHYSRPKNLQFSLPTQRTQEFISRAHEQKQLALQLCLRKREKEKQWWKEWTACWRPSWKEWQTCPIREDSFYRAFLTARRATQPIISAARSSRWLKSHTRCPHYSSVYLWLHNRALNGWNLISWIMAWVIQFRKKGKFGPDSMESGYVALCFGISGWTNLPHLFQRTTVDP